MASYYNTPDGHAGMQAWVTGEVINNDTKAAPVPCPTKVMEFGSPRNSLIFSLNQASAAI